MTDKSMIREGHDYMEFGHQTVTQPVTQSSDQNTPNIVKRDHNKHRIGKRRFSADLPKQEATLIDEIKPRLNVKTDRELLVALAKHYHGSVASIDQLEPDTIVSTVYAPKHHSSEI